MTQDQLGTCIAIEKEGFQSVTLLVTHMTPIPGLILMADCGHQQLLMVAPDGRAIDLLAVYAAAEDCIRNWHKGDNLNLPQFVGDFGRLTKIAEAVNGRKL